MKHLFVEFPKAQGEPNDSSHRTVVQTLRSFREGTSLMPVLKGIAANATGDDGDRTGMVPGYCISPDINIQLGNNSIIWYPNH